MNDTAILNSTQPMIVQLLHHKGILDKTKLDALREAQSKDNGPVDAVLVRKGFATDREIAAAYAEHLRIPLYEPSQDGPAVQPELSRLLPEKLCRDQLMVPVALNGDTLELAFVSPNELLIVDEVQLLTGCKVRPLITPLSVVERLLGVLYRPGAAGAPTEFGGTTEEIEQIEDEADKEE